MVRTILIVDNDLATLELYQRELGRTYRVLTSTNEREASEVLHAEEVSVVVLEPVALGEQGWANLVELTRTPRQRRVPVLVCSTQDDRKHSREMGAVACLVKPVLPTALLDALRNIERRA